jgi:hypothetical protein
MFILQLVFEQQRNLLLFILIEKIERICSFIVANLNLFYVRAYYNS